MNHGLMSKVIEKQRGIIAAITAILGVLVGFGIIRAQDQTAILSAAGIVFAWLGGSSYVSGKHVEAAALIASKAPAPTAMNPTATAKG